jgi:hypothetical protein
VIFVLYFFLNPLEASFMTEPDYRSQSDRRIRLRLRTPAAGSDTSAASTPDVSSDGKPEAQSSQHTAGVAVLVVLLLFFVAGGFGLYKVITYAPPAVSDDKSQPSEPAARSSRVASEMHPEAKRSDATAEVIVGQSEEPVLTVFQTPIELVQNADGAANGAESEVNGAGEVSSASGSTADKEHTEAIRLFLADRFIGSVRLGENDPRVILDGRSYSQGDTIEGPYKIRFVAAREGVLYFEDEQGIVYRRRF